MCISFCLQVVIENGQATGVEVEFNGSKMQIKCKQEVLLTGGVVGSPQLLMLSGIGPKKHLESLNVSNNKSLEEFDNATCLYFKQKQI